MTKAATLWSDYASGWQAMEEDERSKVVARTVEQNVRYVTPYADANSSAAPEADMAAFQRRVPGGRFDLLGVSEHHNVAILQWGLLQADGSMPATGYDVVEVSENGKLASIHTFAAIQPADRPSR